MTKPVIVTRAGKGSALTWTEGDTNLTNLRDATITVSDGTTSTAIDLNGTITFTAGSGISVDESTGTITISNTQSAGISNVVEDTTPQLGGTLDANGNSIDMGTNTITDTKVGNWDTAYGWGNHASGGYVTSGGALGTPSSGTLTNATGLPVSTGISGLGTGVATFLATPSSANLISAVTDETGTGALVFANTPTLVTPVLGTPTSGTLSNCTVDGTNSVGYRDLPAVGTKTSSYQLTTSDVGKYVQVGSGGSITIPDATFSEGDVVVIANNHSSAITITCSITTAYIAGTDTDKASVSLATRGVCNILFLSGTVCIITGNVS